MLIAYDGKNIVHEKSDVVKGDHLHEMNAFNRGVYSTGKLDPLIVPTGNFVDYRYVSRNTQARVHNNCVNKIVNEGQVAENYFEAIYERREAVNMAAAAAKTMLTFLTNYRKPQYWRKTLKREPSDLPKAWIGYQFGVAPLISTIDSALNFLGKPYPSYLIKGASGAPVNFSEVDKSPWITETSSANGSYFKQIRAYVRPNPNPNMGLLNLVGLNTPFSTAWSVIPWSWAVDYFVNASNLMSNFENRFPGIYFDSIWESVLFKADFSTVQYSRATEATTMNRGHAHNFWRQPSDLEYSLEFSFPSLGGEQLANLLSAIALTLKGKS